MKYVFFFLLAVFFLTTGFFIGRSQIIVYQQTTSVNTTPTNTPTPTPQQINSPSLIPTAGNGPKNDIVQIQPMTASKSVAQVGDDISFSVTIQNQAPYSKNIQAICFNNTEGNFGCQNGKNLGPNETFNINNSGRFYSGGTKSVWITWTQDNVNYFRPLNGSTATVTIQN